MQYARRKIWIKPELINLIFDEIQVSSPQKTGGLLLGYNRLDDIVITHCLAGYGSPNSSKNWYRPDTKKQNEDINRILKSNKGIRFIGEWRSKLITSLFDVFLVKREDILLKMSLNPLHNCEKPILIDFDSVPDSQNYSATRLLKKNKRLWPRCEVELEYMEVIVYEASPIK